MTLGVNNVMTLSVNNVMTSSVQKVVTHNTRYVEPRYQLPRIDKSVVEVICGLENLFHGCFGASRSS